MLWREEINKKKLHRLSEISQHLLRCFGLKYLLFLKLFGENDPGIRRCEVIKGSSITN